MTQDPGSNPKVPVGGLTIANNSDGTFTVASSDHSVTIGQPRATQDKKGRRGGFVVAGIVSTRSLPPGAIPVGNTNELADKLKSITKGRVLPKEVHFVLMGKHTLNMGKLAASAGGASIITHIHMDSAPDSDPDSGSPPVIPIGG